MSNEALSWWHYFCNSGAVRVASLLVVTSGLLHGCSVGYVSAYLGLHDRARDCGARTTTAACGDAEHAGCVWLPGDHPHIQNTSLAAGVPAVARCAAATFASADCGAVAIVDNAAMCSAIPACRWHVEGSRCREARDWEAWQMGLFAGSHVIGGVTGPATAKLMLGARSGRFRPVFFAALASIVVGMGLLTAGRLTLSYWVLLLGRLFFGAATAAMRFLGPLYAFRACPLHIAQQSSSLLEPGTHLSVLFHFLIALALNPTDAVLKGDTPPMMEMRLHALVLFAGIFVACFALLAMLIREPKSVVSPPPSPPRRRLLARVTSAADAADAAGELEATNEPTVDVKANDNQQTLREEKSVDGDCIASPRPPQQALRFSNLKHILVCAAVGGAFMLTGMGPLASFTSTYGAAIYGLSNLSAPLLISAVSIPAGILGAFGRRYFRNPRPLLLVGVYADALALLFLIALPTLPVVGALPAARNALACIGLVAFCGFHQFCIGPTVFELGIRVMPPHLVDWGGSILSTGIAAYSFSTNMIFPVIVDAFSNSGAASDAERNGYSAAIGTFGMLGLQCATVLFCFMHPYDDGMALQTLESEEDTGGDRAAGANCETGV